MIPTRWKSKLPKHLSYPIGAAALSEALADAPHAAALTIWFVGSDWPDSGDRRARADQFPHEILTAEFRPADYRGYSEDWILHVSAVPRDLRHLANRLLRERGLAHLSRWLRASQQTGWTSRYQCFELRFLPAKELITAHESSGAGLAAKPIATGHRHDP